MPDVDMKPDEDKKADEKKEVKIPVLSPAEEIRTNLALIDKAVTTMEPRFTHRVLRTFSALRKRIDASVLRAAVEDAYTKGKPEMHTLVCF